ncbi:EIF4B [Cordylochernes scorpioides]|uniref:EIF4B n=1 Tax=Cordylochernes scorpioides TaxID=51811 RepID=A0ABY6KM30_9ARAC|nr:EIF4B [Cordylochernes scorpioides]
MSNKGSKKSKANKNSKTVTLSSFLAGDQDVPSGYTVVKPSRTNWAEVMEDESIDDKFILSNVVLPTAPKAARAPYMDLSRIPTQPPFTAYIGNLAYDITEEDIKRFFRNMKIVSIRLPREQGEKSQMRGFGYVEFETRDFLIEALSLNNEKLRSRIVKINLAEDKEHCDRKGGGEELRNDWRPKDNDGWKNEYRERYRNRTHFESRRYEEDLASRDRIGRKGSDSENCWRRSTSTESRDPSIHSSINHNQKERPKLILLPRSIPKDSSVIPHPSILGGGKTGKYLFS